jgi:hypothetical protein
MPRVKSKRRHELDRAGWLLVHGVSAAAWCERWQIEPFSCPCRGCGAMLTPDQPFASGSLRGLVARPCACGYHDHQSRGTPYCVVRDPKHGDLFSGAPK